MSEHTETLKATPGPAYRLWDAFIGTWTTTGNMKTSAGEPDLEIVGTDTYEWLPGGFFIMHKADVVIGQDRRVVTEIIGFDATTQRYPMTFFDSNGDSGIMHASEHHGIWTFVSEALRYTGAFNDNKSTMSGIWEHEVQGNWEFLMDIKLEREC